MLKIGFDAQRLFTDKGGLGNYSRSSVELLSKFYPENEYSLFSAFDENKVGFTTQQTIKIINPDSVIGNITPTLWRSCGISKDIKRERVDIFHGLCNELPLDIRVSGAKSVVTIHNLIFRRFPNLYSKADKICRNFRYKNSCNNADIIIATSNQTKEDLIEFCDISPERIAVVYQSCNSMYHKKINNEDREQIRKRYSLPSQYILSVGTLEERKNIMLTLHALHEGKIDIPFVVCGNNTPYAEKLKNYIAENGMENQVIFLHNCDLDELPALYQMATATVYVSLFEGFGIPIVESLYSGTPVITTRGGVFPEAGGDAALYVGPYDLEEMIDTLRRVINDNTLREDVIEKGYNFAQNFSESNIAKNIIEVYNTIL